MANDEEMITAQVGVFSGRENPKVSLADTAQMQFVELLRAAIGAVPIHAPAAPKLGQFYGFMVRVPARIAEEFRIPGNVEVRAGVVSTYSKEQAAHWRDTSGLERFLIGLAFDQGHGDILKEYGVKPSRDAK